TTAARLEFVEGTDPDVAGASQRFMCCDVLFPRPACCRAKALVGMLTIVTMLFGCSRNVERSDSALPLPAVAKDQAEQIDAGENWPGWRGINTSGISSDQHAPVEWTLQRGVRWKCTVPGHGNSSPVIWGEQVLVTASLGENEGSRLAVYSFDRRTGKPRWNAD